MADLEGISTHHHILILKCLCKNSCYFFLISSRIVHSAWCENLSCQSCTVSFSCFQFYMLHELTFSVRTCLPCREAPFVSFCTFEIITIFVVTHRHTDTHTQTKYCNLLPTQGGLMSLLLYGYMHLESVTITRLFLLEEMVYFWVKYQKSAIVILWWILKFTELF